MMRSIKTHVTTKCITVFFHSNKHMWFTDRRLKVRVRKSHELACHVTETSARADNDSTLNGQYCSHSVHLYSFHILHLYKDIFETLKPLHLYLFSTEHDNFTLLILMKIRSEVCDRFQFQNNVNQSKSRESEPKAKHRAEQCQEVPKIDLCNVIYTKPIANRHA